jgi:hypothetical protein
MQVQSFYEDVNRWIFCDHVFIKPVGFQIIPEMRVLPHLQDMSYLNSPDLMLSMNLEHLHPWAERQNLEMCFEGLQACTKFF